MRELTRFKNQIFLHGIIFALLIEVGSLFVLGLDGEFSYGLAVGTCIAVVNFNILVLTGKALLNARKPLMGLASYVLRLCVYGFAFYMALRVSLVSGMGAALGFFTIKLGIYNIYVIKPWFMKKWTKVPETETDDAGVLTERDDGEVAAVSARAENTSAAAEGMDRSVAAATVAAATAATAESVSEDGFDSVPPSVNSGAKTSGVSEVSSGSEFGGDKDRKKRSEFWREVFGSTFDEDEED